MIIAVTGITGHTGRFFLKELEEHKFEGTVRCLVRKTSDTKLLDDSSLNIEKIVGLNTEYETLLQLTQGADVIMHIYNIHSSVNMLKAAIENNVPRVVMVHTTGVYSKYKMASEEYKVIEKEIDALLKTSEIDLTILRPTMIFGDMCDHNISKFISMVDKLPFMPEISHGRGRIRPVNARDLGKAYYTVCMMNNLPQVYYDLSGERSLSLHELFDLTGKFLGKKTHHISCPMPLAKTGAVFLKSLSLGKVNLVERVLRMSEDRDYDHLQAKNDFGYRPESFDAGLKREVDEYMKLRGHS